MLTFGMIGASRIGGEALLEPVARCDGVRVTRVAARRPGAAEAYSRRWRIPHAATRYEDVVDDPEIDVVYVANAAADHAQWTIAALEAGKHVLCEKPIAVNAREAAAVDEAANRASRLVMEGFHYRFHPFFARLKDLVEEGRLGRLRSIDSAICGARPYDAASILHVARWGGGALLHSGVYGIHWTRALFDAEPVVIDAEQKHNSSGADSETTAELGFSDGRRARVVCSFDQEGPVSATLEFERGQVVATGIITPHHGHSLRVAPHGAAPEVSTIAGLTSFDYQLAEFQRRLSSAGGLGRHGIEDDLVGNMKVVDAIRRSAAEKSTLRGEHSDAQQ